MSRIEKLMSQKSRPMVAHRGFIYTLERTLEDKCTFRCKNRNCKARCHTNLSMDFFMLDPTAHSHAPNPEQIPAIEAMNKIKMKVVSSDEATSSIIQSSLRALPLTAVSSLPSPASLVRTVRRQRPTPCSTSNSLLLDLFRKTDRGEDFVLYEDNQMIICATTRNLSLLKQCKHWFVDGTFKVCPEEFYINYSHADDYKKFFEKVLEHDDFEPESILSDFESGTIKTIKDIFPNSAHRGCLFHFGQAVWRHVQDNGLTRKYEDDDTFRLNVRKLLVLPFVSASEVIEAFDLLADDFDDEAENLVEYFEETWIGEKKIRGNGRKKPKFNNELWNVYEHVMNNLPRSNNAVEAWLGIARKI
ncbi:unnamed protein product [Adineta ricciae]|uniref:MULE transposase domain-containing protein n=1 Tax=Adineta ricciae TaxID=249248 RepID=A0A815LWC6_ADIRI|nr:unnamed protein product [Adineta ricciae]